MRKITTQLFFASSLAFIASTGLAHAAILGSIWENDVTGASNAIPGNVPGTTPDVTFSIPGTTINMQSGGAYTIGEFLTSGGASVLTGAGQLGNTLDNTIFDFTGTVSVTTGETFTVGHDDGLTLIIGGSTVISAPGPTSFTPTTGTYTGPSGNFAFQIVYGECCGSPGDLEISGLALVSTTPLPAALPLFAGGLGLLGMFARRRKQTTSVLAA
jgi:hypothetical protein